MARQIYSTPTQQPNPTLHHLPHIVVCVGARRTIARWCALLNAVARHPLCLLRTRAHPVHIRNEMCLAASNRHGQWAPSRAPTCLLLLLVRLAPSLIRLRSFQRSSAGSPAKETRQVDQVFMKSVYILARSTGQAPHCTSTRSHKCPPVSFRVHCVCSMDEGRYHKPTCRG